MFAALGRFAYRRRWWVVTGWALVLLAGLLSSGATLARLGSVDALSPNAESARADRVIAQVSDDGPIVYAVISGVDLYAPPLVESVRRVSGELRTLPEVVEVRDLYTAVGGVIGADNRSTVVTVQLAEGLAAPRLEATEDAVRDRLHTIAAPTVLVGGDHLAERAFGEQAGRDLAVGETVAVLALLVALLLIFRGVLAACLPLAVAITGLGATMLVLLAVSTFLTVGDYALNVVTLLGLGLAVDYALLLLVRYREELAKGAARPVAVVTAVDRAGRAVAISGAVVVVSLLGLAGFAEPLLASMALGGAAVVLLTTLLALTLVPALLALAGARIVPADTATWTTRLVDRLRAVLGRARPGPAVPWLVRLARQAQHNPAPVALVAALGLLLLAVPVVGAHFANSDARALPASSEERQAYQEYERLVTQHESAPVTLVATVDAGASELREYLNHLNRLGGVQRLALRSDVTTGTVIIDLVPAGAPADLVRAVRADRPDFPLLVTGAAAQLVDYQQSVATRLPFALGVIVLAVLVLLAALTRSLVVAVKAILLGAVTFLAALGVLVALFQWGWGEQVLRFDSWGALDLTTPLLLFVFSFGLCMDYEVFLLARIREEYDRLAGQRERNDRAVLAGIAYSGPVVTAAAVCITIVFLGFAAGGLVALKEIGVGMAVAVILDVTVVRGLLLPAVMTLLGDLNWWLPGRRGLRREADASVLAGP